MNRKVSLAGIMDQWEGQDIVLRVQAARITVVDSKRSKVTGGIGLFSRLAQGSRNLSYRRSGEKENLSRGEQQFVIKAKSRNRAHRVSLADLGDLYNTSRFKTIKPERRISENYPENYSSNRPIGNSYLTVNGKNTSGRQENQSRYQTEHRPLSQMANQNYQQANTQYTERKGYTKNRAEEELEIIKESINGIRLPSDHSFSPEYASANDRFEKMKREILQKIIQNGQINELSQILKQIRQAADQIIARHCPSEPTLKKHIFSFKDIQSDPIVQPSLNLNPISEEAEDKGISLPQFKDDAGSISSILSGSGIGLKKDESKDEDECKIGNVFIQDNDELNLNCFENGGKGDESSSIKLIKLNDEKKDDDIVEILKEVKQEQKIEMKQESKMEDPIKIESSMRVKNTIVQSNAYNFTEKVAEQNRPEVKQSLFKKKEEVCQPCLPSIPYDTYNLERLTSQPVKIISNLQQAKKFDPEVTKYTELKVQYLQTRTITPQIIRIASPLRFRRKQEVVKHLVANHVVDRESNSIQF